MGIFSFFRDRRERAVRQREESAARHAMKMSALNRQKILMKGAWEAADRDRANAAVWLTSQLSVTSDMENELVDLWDRAADLIRNDPYASSAVSGRVDNVVGSGMTFHSRVRVVEGIGYEVAKQINETRERLFKLWARKDKFKRKQRLFERSVATFGEGLGILSDGPTLDGRPIPLTWQVINPRRLQAPPEQASNPLIRLGIEFTDETYTQVRGYWIKDVEQNDTRTLKESFTFYDSWRVTHCFEELVPGQLRGVPWLAPVMPTLKDIKDYGEAKLIAEQVGACTTTFISCQDPYGQAISNGTDSSRGYRAEELSPGTIQYIGENDKVTHIDPNRPGNSYAPFIEHKLMQISAGLRYPYALLAKDFRKMSFANGRLEFSDGRQSFECWQNALIDDALLPIVERASLEMAMLGLLPVEPRIYLADEMAYCACQIKPTRWRMAVNPKQEVDADAAEVEAGFASKTDKCDEREHDFEDVLAAREREAIAELESKARIMKRAEELGLAAPAPPEPGKPGEPEEDDEEAKEYREYEEGKQDE